mgnify:CR=1 FL=1
MKYSLGEVFDRQMDWLHPLPLPSNIQINDWGPRAKTCIRELTFVILLVVPLLILLLPGSTLILAKMMNPPSVEIPALVTLIGFIYKRPFRLPSTVLDHPSCAMVRATTAIN